MEKGDSFATIATLIGQQTDQLWSIAMAVIVAEIVTVCSFFKNPTPGWKWQASELLLLVSIVCHGLSLFCGYLTKGALVEMIKATALQRDRFFNAAADSSLWQFYFLVAGIILFVVVFWMKRSEVSKALLGGKK